MKVEKPYIEKIEDNIESLNNFEKEISKLEDDKKKKIIMRFPSVYIHSWKKKDKYEVYVGESNNIFQRTKQHYGEMKNESDWQHNLSKGKANLYVIGHEHFNKSMTMDIETKLIHYLTSVESIVKVHNGRDNPQDGYYPVEELDSIFAEIWKELRNKEKEHKEIFPLESSIKDSAIFKASPLHKLTEEQKAAKEKILDRIDNALRNDKRGQLIFIEGEAGTGKTVLNSSTFYELFCRNEEASKEDSEKSKYQTTNYFLLVNHDEQITVYRQIFNKLGITDKYGEVVEKPTHFINNHSIENPVDVVFVDEAHLLLTQGKYSYKKGKQLKDIIDRAKVVVVMFDENQILTTEQYWEHDEIEKYKNEARENDNYIMLENQLRMHASKEVIDWINSFTKDGIIKDMPRDLGGYDIKIFDNPKLLDKEIKNKASKDESRLSRIISTYDWEYSKDNHKGCPTKYWEVKIKYDDSCWHKPWNRELDRKQKRSIDNLAWAEKPQTINEVGSTYTIQGFDLNYAGLILGLSVKYKDGHIVFDPKASWNKKAKKNRTLSDGTQKKFGEELLKHELRVLMTRGVNGLYIYACDDNLRKQLKKCMGGFSDYEIDEDERVDTVLKIAENSLKDSEKYRN